MRRYVLSLAALVFLFTVVGQAHAVLIGDEVVIQYVFSPDPKFSSDAKTPTVAKGPDLNGFSHSLSGQATIIADLEASSISITFADVVSIIAGGISFATAPFNGLQFTDLDWVGMPDGEIIGFTLNTNDIGTLDAQLNLIQTDPIVSFGPDSIAANFSDLHITDASTVNITLLTEGHNAPIPEPGTLLLIGSGLVGIGVGARRRGRRK